MMALTPTTVLKIEAFKKINATFQELKIHSRSNPHQKFTSSHLPNQSEMDKVSYSLMHHRGSMDFYELSTTFLAVFLLGACCISISLAVTTLTGMKWQKHHHHLLFMITLGLALATSGLSLCFESLFAVTKDKVVFYHFVLHISRDGLTSLGLAATSMMRLFLCLRPKATKSSMNAYPIFSWSLILAIGAIRTAIQTLTFGTEYHHQSIVLFCDGFITFWDLGCCLLVFCICLTRIGGCSRIENNECANCQGEFGYDPIDDGFLISNVTSVLARILILTQSFSAGFKSTEGHAKIWDLFLLGYVIPIIIFLNIRKELIKPGQKVKKRFVKPIEPEQMSEVTSAIELDNLDESFSTMEQETMAAESTNFFLPRSKSDHSGRLFASLKGNPDTFFSVIRCMTPSKSCGCSTDLSTQTNDRPRPLDDMLTQLIGRKEKTVLDEPIEDDTIQINKLKASLSIQAICSVAGNDRKDDLLTRY